MPLTQVSPIPTLSVTMQLLAQISTAQGTPTIRGTPSLPSPFPAIPTAQGQNFQNLATLPVGVQLAQQARYDFVTVPVAAPVTQDLTAAFTNLIGSITATFGTGLNGIIWFLPTVTQAAALNITIAAQASGVTIGNTAATQFLGPLANAASALTLAPGDIHAFVRTGATPWSLLATLKNLLFTDNDGANAATVVFFYIGS